VVYDPPASIFGLVVCFTGNLPIISIHRALRKYLPL
jgi:hypothetical protein